MIKITIFYLSEKADKTRSRFVFFKNTDLKKMSSKDIEDIKEMFRGMGFRLRYARQRMSHYSFEIVEKTIP